jgi:hypothetical protein
MFNSERTIVVCLFFTSMPFDGGPMAAMNMFQRCRRGPSVNFYLHYLDVGGFVKTC